MGVQVENLDANTAKLTVDVPAEELDKAMQEVYRKNKNKYSVPGFRKGKVPYSMIEKMYGPEMFYEDAANALVPKAYTDAAKESGLEIVAHDDLEVVKIEKGSPFVFTVEVTLKPEVTLGKYKGIKVEEADTSVSDEEVDAELDKVKEQNSRLIVAEEGQEAKDGDQVTIDFEGFVDGEAFEGGKGADYPLTLGSHSFIDNFEEQIVGHKSGDDFEVNVTFPDEYNVKELAGKPAVFKVSVKEIKKKEYPEVDDDFAQDVSEFDTLEEYKADIKKTLEDKKIQDAKAQKEDNVIEAIVKDAKMDIPEKMIDAQASQMLEEFAQNIQMQGISMDQYLQYTGTTMDQMNEQMKPQAKKRIESSLVLEAVAKAENIEVSDEELDKELDDMAEKYNMKREDIDGILPEDEKENIRKDLMSKKAAKFVVEESK